MNASGQRGLSLLEVIFSLGILGLAATGVHRVLTGHQKQVQMSKNISASSRLADNLTSSTKRLLTEVKSRTTGKNTEGICQWARINPSSSPGVGTVYLELPGMSSTTGGFSLNRWGTVFSDWNLVEKSSHDSCRKVDNYSKCFMPKQGSIFNQKEFEESRSAEWLAQLQIIPVYMNPGSGYFHEVAIPPGVESKIEPVADIAFKIMIDLYYKKANKRYRKSYESFVWAPLAGTCDKNTNGNRLRLSLSGLGSSDPSGRTLYNIPKFTQSGANPVDVEFLKVQAQVGQINSQNQFISTNSSQNIAVSCNERKYQCPNLPSDTRNYDQVNIKMALQYKPFNNLAGAATQMQLNPSFSMKKGGLDALRDSGARARFFMDGSQNPKSSFIVNGTHGLNVNIQNQNGNASPMCRRICEDSSNYNTAGSSSYDRYTPAFKYSFAGFENLPLFNANSDSPVGCTACYMKNCSQLGLGTFGPMQNQPYQPLDSNVPECWVNERSDTNSYQKKSGFNGVGCVAAKLDDNNPGKLLLAASDCSENKPVLCYNFGAFSLAEDITPSNRSIIQSSFEDAQNACFKMGKEVVDSDLDLNSNIGAYVTSAGSNKYKFFNIVSQGLFIAPQIEKDVKSYHRWITRNGTTNNWIWTNLRYKNGKIYAPPPLISTDRPSKELGLIHDSTGRLSAIKADTPIENLIDTGMNLNHYLLFHNLRYKGAIHARDQQRTPFRVLCMKGQSIIVSSQRTNNVANAKTICANSGNAKFIAPSTSIDWVKALMAVKPSSDGFPAPMLDNYDDIAKMEPIWVSNVPKGFSPNKPAGDDKSDQDIINRPTQPPPPKTKCGDFGGKEMNSFCYFLGGQGQSCREVCGARQLSFNKSGTCSAVGFSSGCGRVLTNLMGRRVSASRFNISGTALGCALHNNRSGISSNQCTGPSAYRSARRVCACNIP